MQSLTSRGYVKEKFSWQWFYYSLTNEVPKPESAICIVWGRVGDDGKGTGFKVV